MLEKPQVFLDFPAQHPQIQPKTSKAETDNTGGMKESLDAKPADVSASTIRKDLRSAEPGEQLLSFRRRI